MTDHEKAFQAALGATDEDRLSAIYTRTAGGPWRWERFCTADEGIRAIASGWGSGVEARCLTLPKERHAAVLGTDDMPRGDE